MITQEKFYRESGMSLRDWFAGQALTGMVSGGWIAGDESKLASHLYKFADAMLAARATSAKAESEAP